VGYLQVGYLQPLSRYTEIERGSLPIACIVRCVPVFEGVLSYLKRVSFFPFESRPSCSSPSRNSSTVAFLDGLVLEGPGESGELILVDYCRPACFGYTRKLSRYTKVKIVDTMICYIKIQVREGISETSLDSNLKSLNRSLSAL